MGNLAQNIRKEFGPGDCTISAFDREVTGWKSVSYNSTQAATLNKTGNNRATSYSMGDITDTFQIELYMSQVREWEKVAKDRHGRADLLLLEPVSLAVNYVNDDLAETTDVITFKILSQGREIATGSDGLAYQLETLVLGIEYDV